MPILGIYASAMQPALNASSYESIATYTVGAGGQTADIVFSSIPQTYAHLQVRALIKQNIARQINFRMNGSGTTYAYHYLYGNGSTVNSGGTTSAGTIQIAPGVSYPNDTDTGIFGALIIDILDYANTNKYKTIRALTGYDTLGGSNKGIELDSGVWMQTTAVTELDFLRIGNNWSQYTTFALYGIKG